MKCQWCGEVVRKARHKVPVNYIDQEQKKIIPRLLLVCDGCKADIDDLKRQHNQAPDKPAVMALAEQ